jgi:hypothetical protein
MATRRTRLVPASHKRPMGVRLHAFPGYVATIWTANGNVLTIAYAVFAVGAAVLLAAGAAEAVVPEADGYAGFQSGDYPLNHP